ncbi:TIGR03985 family CRISPR-associated protein [Trichothermofontia sp.]
MTEAVFTDRPSLELLQWLARGSLKQNLLRAIRLWVLLQSLYGPRETCLDLPNSFTYADWRSAFFSDSHPKGEEIPGEHDPTCSCAKTTGQWLSEALTDLLPNYLEQWQQALQQYTKLTPSELDNLLSDRLFARTRRSLQADFQALVELQWLDRRHHHYVKVNSFPPYPTHNAPSHVDARFESNSLSFLNPDLASLAHTLSQEIGGYQRFFLHVDYIVSQEVVDRVEDWQAQLQEIWAQQPIPPLAITYYSARLDSQDRYYIYPVCIYYAQRAAYLCAFGETPITTGQWYNYRLDRIQALQPLSWQDTQLPECLRQIYPRQLPTPDYIDTQLANAWGFDFYLAERTLLLRFERNFHDRYIRDTFRHETFTQISYQAAKRLIQQNCCPAEQQQLLAILKARSETDAYYRAIYRDGDTNIRQRLRAWRPHGEILLPWHLRQAMRQEARAEYQLYQS